MKILDFVFKKLRVMFLLLFILIKAPTVPAEDFYAGQCVSSGGFNGVVVSKVIHDKKKNQKWCFVYTKDGILTIDISSLDSESCSKCLKDFPQDKKKILLNWLEGGISPMMLPDI